MSGLGDDFRRRAETNNAEAEKLFESSNFATDRKVQAAATIAKVTANMLSLLGELVDYLRQSDVLDEATTRRQARAERFAELRKAFTMGASSGDYSDYDRILVELGQSIGGGQSGTTGSPGE